MSLTSIKRSRAESTASRAAVSTGPDMSPCKPDRLCCILLALPERACMSLSRADTSGVGAVESGRGLKGLLSPSSCPAATRSRMAMKWSGHFCTRNKSRHSQHSGHASLASRTVPFTPQWLDRQVETFELLWALLQPVQPLACIGSNSVTTLEQTTGGCRKPVVLTGVLMPRMKLTKLWNPACLLASKTVCPAGQNEQGIYGFCVVHPR